MTDKIRTQQLREELKTHKQKFDALLEKIEILANTNFGKWGGKLSFYLYEWLYLNFYQAGNEFFSDKNTTDEVKLATAFNQFKSECEWLVNEKKIAAKKRSS